MLNAFAGTGINLTVTILDPMKINSLEEARKWVQGKYDFFSRCNIRCIYFGKYIFDQVRVDKALIAGSLKALRWMREALDEQEFNDVQVNFVNYEGIFRPNIRRPSEAEFPDEYKRELKEYLRFLQENDAPFPIDSIPLTDNAWQNFSMSFAFPDGASNFVIKDVNGAVYTNTFEWRFDCYVWAMRKLNFTNLRIVVGQVGWPTDGFPGATAANAERFFKHFLPWVQSKKGTPMRPGGPIDVNIHALTDETKMKGPPFTRHWGIYRSNGMPKYKIDLTGQGRDIYPTTVRGIMRMPNRWCVFNGDHGSIQKVKEQLDYACSQSDCTSTVTGGSCSGLSFEQNVTYAFNMLFQFNFQDEKFCDFEGLGRVAVHDPSTAECVFPVEVVKGQQLDFKPPPAAAVGEGFRRSRPSFVLFVLWLPILLWVV